VWSGSGRSKYHQVLQFSDVRSWHFSGETVSLNLGLMTGVKQTQCRRANYRSC
jgi:hypothetical protein